MGSVAPVFLDIRGSCDVSEAKSPSSVRTVDVDAVPQPNASFTASTCALAPTIISFTAISRPSTTVATLLDFSQILRGLDAVELDFSELAG